MIQLANVSQKVLEAQALALVHRLSDCEITKREQWKALAPMSRFMGDEYARVRRKAVRRFLRRMGMLDAFERIIR